MGAKAMNSLDSKLKAAVAVDRLVKLLAEERRGLVVVVIYALGIGLASLSAPLGVQMLVNAIAFGGLVQPIVILSILVLTALAFASVLRAAQAWVAERIQQRLFVRVAMDLAERLPRARASTFDREHGPEIVQRFLDVVTLQKGAAMLLLDGILVAQQVAVGGLVLALYHPALLGFAVALLVGIVGILFGLGGNGSATSIDESKAKYALLGWFGDLARHTWLFRGDGGSSFARARSELLIRAYVAKRSKHFSIVFRQTSAFLALQAVATAALLAVGGWLVLGGKLTLGQLVAAELILTSVVASFAKFGKYIETYYDTIAAVDKLGTLADIEVERDGLGQPRDTHMPARIEAVDLSFAYGEGRSVLRDVSFQVAPGERVALCGPHGSGKSTLVDILFGLREPTSGHVEIDGLALRDLSLPGYRAGIAIVREGAVFDGTIFENVAMARPQVTLDVAKEALDAVGLWPEIAGLASGLDTTLTTNGTNVSTGFAQKLAIARALAGRPRVLVVDEALDRLDPGARELVLASILDPSKPWTALVATRQPDVAASFPHVISLGSAEEVSA